MKVSERIEKIKQSIANGGKGECIDFDSGCIPCDPKNPPCHHGEKNKRTLAILKNTLKELE